MIPMKHNRAEVHWSRVRPGRKRCNPFKLLVLEDKERQRLVVTTIGSYYNGGAYDIVRDGTDWHGDGRYDSSQAVF